jgi:hypothetical protein
VFNSLRYVNLVELFKLIGEKVVGHGASKKKRGAYSRISVDVFIVLKFLTIGVLMLRQTEGQIALAGVWYLLSANIYTYFYYHLWSERVLKDTLFGIDRIKRRFMTLSLAVLFSVIAFSYLFRVPYSAEFTWPGEKPNVAKALLYSAANSFGASYDQVSPATELGRVVSIVQFLTMFVFLAIILSNSIPQVGANQEDD